MYCYVTPGRPSTVGLLEELLYLRHVHTRTFASSGTADDGFAPPLDRTSGFGSAVSHPQAEARSQSGSNILAPDMSLAAHTTQGEYRY